MDPIAIAQYVETLFPAPQKPRVERVAEGVSTIVYRISSAEHTYYLRIAPEAGVNLAAEVAVHRHLAALGLHIPNILHFEPLHPLFQRSLMLVSAIAGQAIGYTEPPPGVRAILQQAGRELAHINQVPVQGYGWANSIAPHSGFITAEYAILSDWLQVHFAAPIQALVGCDMLSVHDVARIARLLDRACVIFADEPAVLAHGDFDLTHIYYQDDTFTGVIDFGEVRGAHWLYDLSHFAIESGHLLPFLLAGYEEIRPLAPTDREHLRLTSILIAARRMGRCILQRRPPHTPDIEYIVASLSY
jgi:aminoglycoside phosphotransferase (APT) family kinase protein